MEGKKPGSVHAGHRARIRERFLQQGFEGFSDHEILELLLTYAIPQRDVNPLAHQLIDHFGSLSAVFDAHVSELEKVPGMGRTAATLLCMVPQLTSRYQFSAMGDKPELSTLAKAKQYCKALFVGVHEERFYIICLDHHGRVIHRELAHVGTLDQIMVYPRTVAEIAMRHHARAVMLAHNHPGGILQPSQEDYSTTRVIIQALRGIQIDVVDHLIVSGSGVYSMMRESQEATCPDEEFSYMMRSSHVPGRRGRLKEEDEAEFVTLNAEDMD